MPSSQGIEKYIPHPQRRSDGRIMSTPKRALAQKQQAQKKEQTTSEKIRTTLILNEQVDIGIEVCAAMERKQKSDIVNEALTEFLKKRGHL
jgi:hypothetical protein